VSERDLRPLALEWGGQVFDESGRRSAFAVATSLSNVCKLLDVELVTDQARGVSDYWGRTGHYSIAAFATELVGDPDLKAFLKKNLTLLSFDLQTIQKKDFDVSVRSGALVTDGARACTGSRRDGESTSGPRRVAEAGSALEG